MTEFTWLPIYAELADKVLGYRDRQDELITLTERLRAKDLPVIATEDQFADGSAGTLREIDPFTFFANFNRSISDENRRAILAEFKREFELIEPVPGDFTGIPTANNMAAWFFAYDKDRQPGDVDTLWDIAAATRQGTPDELEPNLFERALAVSRVGLAKLTMGMFWFKPDNYVSLDKNMRKFLSAAGIPAKGIDNYSSYRDLLRQVRDQFGDDFKRLSLKARLSEPSVTPFAAGLPSVTPEVVERAMREFDRKHRRSDAWAGWERSHEYALVHDGHRYPPKAIVEIATGVPRSGFSGGKEGANKYLEARGFTVQRLTPSAKAVRYWVEKTLVKGRPDREEGDHALGRSLWSPTRDKGGADIYRDMREVQPGDVVFHLVDNKHIAGVSVAAAEARDDFTGLEGTEWEGRTCYDIALSDYVALDPPIDRADFLGSTKYRDALIKLRKTHKVFYNSGLQLNQGAYITEAPQELVRIWAEIYKASSGRELPHVLAVVPSGVTKTDAAPVLDLGAVCAEFAARLTESHVSFGSGHDAFVRAFVASLATKGFVILTGLSGSGKTQIAKCFGQWLGGNYSVVPVRPDWTGAEALFGYEDALQAPDENRRRPWSVPKALEVMLQAARDPDAPYLLVLDEMNLAHVERYFADVLSGMESAEPCLPNLVKGEDGAWRAQLDAPDRIPFPRNLFIVGTVNVDETTYLFSPKVLDRANTMEFRVRAEDLRDDYRKPTPLRSGDPALVHGFLAIARDDNWQVNHPMADQDAVLEHLRTLHHLLAADRFEFGHRVIYEALRFCAMLDAAGVDDVEAALDLQILQKILPRLHGSRRRLEALLRALARFCRDLGERDDASDRYEPEDEKENPRLPLSFDKTRRMLAALRVNQFTSFTE